MKKNNNIQKKKNLGNTISNILFKVLVGIAIIIFSYIIYDKADFSSGSMTFDSPKKKSNNAYTPSDLKWFDSFKGVENVPNKNKKDKNSSKNFMNY
jgi:hypothetical protein